VLGSIVSTQKIQMLGIDLEYSNARERISLMSKMVAPEGVPLGINRRLGTLFAFSAKEAVYKAQFPHRRRSMGYSDVVLHWRRANEWDAEATVDSIVGLEVKVISVCNWIVAVAYLLT